MFFWFHEPVDRWYIKHLRQVKWICENNGCCECLFHWYSNMIRKIRQFPDVFFFKAFNSDIRPTFCIGFSGYWTESDIRVSIFCYSHKFPVSQVIQKNMRLAIIYTNLKLWINLHNSAPYKGVRNLNNTSKMTGRNQHPVPWICTRACMWNGPRTFRFNGCN